MRILVFSTPFYSDSDFPLIKALRSHGHEVFYLIRVAPYMTKASFLDFEPQDQRNQVFLARDSKTLQQWGDYLDLDRSYVANCTARKIGLKSFHVLLGEMKTIKEISPDIIYYIGLPYELHYLALLAHRNQSTVVVHDPLPHSGDDKLRERIKRYLLPLFCKNFILLNNRQKDAFCRKYCVSPKRVIVSSLGPYDCYRSFIPKDCVSNGRFILFWGRLAPYKGIDDAIKAFTMVRDKFPDLRFIIGGAGPLCFDMATVEADERIELIHKYLDLNEIAGYVSQCQFVVCPYTDATQSGVIQTAFAMGAPVVATDVGNFSDIIADGITGLLVPPHNPSALAEAFELMLSNPETIPAMKNNVWRESGKDSLQWQKIAKEYLNAIES